MKSQVGIKSYIIRVWSLCQGGEQTDSCMFVHCEVENWLVWVLSWKLSWKKCILRKLWLSAGSTNLWMLQLALVEDVRISTSPLVNLILYSFISKQKEALHLFTCPWCLCISFYTYVIQIISMDTCYVNKTGSLCSMKQVTVYWSHLFTQSTFPEQLMYTTALFHMKLQSSVT